MIPDGVYERWVPYAANNWVRDTNGCRMMRIGDGYSAINITLDSLDEISHIGWLGSTWPFLRNRVFQTYDDSNHRVV